MELVKFQNLSSVCGSQPELDKGVRGSSESFSFAWGCSRRSRNLFVLEALGYAHNLLDLGYLSAVPHRAS